MYFMHIMHVHKKRKIFLPPPRTNFHLLWVVASALRMHTWAFGPYLQNEDSRVDKTVIVGQRLGLRVVLMRITELNCEPGLPTCCASCTAVVLQREDPSSACRHSGSMRYLPVFSLWLTWHHQATTGRNQGSHPSAWPQPKSSRTLWTTGSMLSLPCETQN